MWDNGLWYILCDGLYRLHFATWPLRRLRCLWIGHTDVNSEYCTPDGTSESGRRRVPWPVKNGCAVETCRDCGARRQYDN